MANGHETSVDLSLDLYGNPVIKMLTPPLFN